jgi:tripartite-type tricarboxylate transporter receptor subunit TctC
MRGKLGISILVIICLSAFAAYSFAEEKFPTRPVYMIVGYPPGGSTDLAARGLAMVAGEYLNDQPLVVVNKTGAQGMLAAKSVASSKPDGHTLLMGWGGPDMVFKMHIAKMPFDVFKDFTPVISVTTFSGCVAVPANSPFKNLNDLVSHARKHPGKLSWSHAGRGGSHYINGRDFVRITKIDAAEIPYLGGVQARNSVAGGHVDCSFFATFLAPEMVAAGKIRVLGICTEERSPLFPDFPTFKEQGYDLINSAGMRMVGAPAGTPDWKIRILHDAFKKCMEHKAFKAFLSKVGMEENYRGPEDALKLAREMSQKYAKLIEQVGIEAFRAK